MNDAPELCPDAGPAGSTQPQPNAGNPAVAAILSDAARAAAEGDSPAAAPNTIPVDFMGAGTRETPGMEGSASHGAPGAAAGLARSLAAGLTAIDRYIGRRLRLRVMAATADDRMADDAVASCRLTDDEADAIAAAAVPVVQKLLKDRFSAEAGLVIAVAGWATGYALAFNEWPAPKKPKLTVIQGGLS